MYIITFPLIKYTCVYSETVCGLHFVFTALEQKTSWQSPFWAQVFGAHEEATNYT